MLKQGVSCFVGWLLCCCCCFVQAQDVTPVEPKPEPGKSKYVAKVPPPTPSTRRPPKPADNTLRNVGLWSGAGLMFLAAPMSIQAIHPELSLSEALVVSASSTGGTLTMALGVVGLSVGAVLLVFSPVIAIFSTDSLGEVMMAALVAGGAGVGMFLLSPLVFNLGVESVDSRLGGQPPGRVGVSFGAMAGGFVGGMVAWTLVEDMEASPVAKSALIFSAALLMSNLSYGLLRLIDKPDQPATMMMSTPLMQF